MTARIDHFNFGCKLKNIYIKAEEGKFPGGEILVFDAKNDGIGIPDENPNLRPDVVSKVAEVYAKLKSGEIVVADVQGDLIR